ncbi:tyrosine-type recombinase/integrase [Campylobacter sp. RM16192]|uniref:tyrosine-type recombinase/integrase n=1 Tax=Campylobacter sp. RM16192 TaxID=1660080 RepID=UPI003FA4D12C
MRSARWGEFDFEKEVWQISSEKMKMRETFTLPLSKQAINLLNEYKSNILPNDFLFPSIIKGKFMSENTLNLALIRMGFSKDVLSSLLPTNIHPKVSSGKLPLCIKICLSLLTFSL